MSSKTTQKRGVAEEVGELPHVEVVVRDGLDGLDGGDDHQDVEHQNLHSDAQHYNDATVHLR